MIKATIHHICQNKSAFNSILDKDDVYPPSYGAILVFVPGWDDIKQLLDSLTLDQVKFPSSSFQILPLHSAVPMNQQRQVFQTPPVGVTKIVLATNIAETSITINDVRYVIDTLRAKEKGYDPYLKLSTLQPTWISQASAKQRRGRAGRTSAGSKRKCKS